MAKYKIIPSSRTIVQSPISIGHKAEKGVEAIEFDLTAWVETYGSGTLTVIMRRWGDAIPYPIALEIDENNKATWMLSDIDTAKAGMAYAQLSYVVGDEVVKKSDIYTFRVMDSLTGEGEPPEAYESWLEQLTHLAAEAMAEVLDIGGIVTDKTLTVDGGIADAKKTGDELTAIKADLDDVNKSLGSLDDRVEALEQGEGGTIVEKTVSGGAVVTVTDGAAGYPIKALSADIELSQSGSGDPSPSNVRSISAFTGANIYRSGADTSSPTTLPVSWETEAGAVCVGTLTLNSDGSADLEATWVKVKFSDIKQNSINISGYGDHFFTTSMYYVAKKANGARNLISSIYKTTQENNVASMEDCSIRGVENVSTLYWRDDRYDTVAEFYADNSNEEIAYELKDPISVHLSNVGQLTTIDGINKIWTDVGDITSLTYSALEQDSGEIVIDPTLSNDGEAADAAATGEAISAVDTKVEAIRTATASDAGKALVAKTIANGKVTEWEFMESGAGALGQNVELSTVGFYWHGGQVGTATESQLNLSTQTSGKCGMVALSKGSILRISASAIQSDTLIRLYFAYNSTTGILIDKCDIIQGNEPKTIYLKYDVDTHVYISVDKNYSYLVSTSTKVNPLCDLSKIIGTKERSIMELNGGEDAISYTLKSMKRKQYKATNTPTVFLHFSDIHGDGENLKRIVEFAKESVVSAQVDDVICSGDVVFNTLTDGMTYFDAVDGAEDILIVVGNHDAVVKEGSNPVATTPQNTYNTIFANKIDGWGVTQPTDAETDGLAYYYKDYSDNNLRVIFVDAVSRSLATDYLTDELTWFEGVLADAITEGLSVACVEHYPFARNTYTYVPCTFSPRYDFNIADGAGTIPTGFVDAVEDFIDAGGEFVAWIAGHGHQDYVLQHNTARQLCIGVSCAIHNGYNIQYGDEVREEYKKSQDLFNIIAIDTVSKNISIMRIGADMTRLLNSKKHLCIDYSTRQVIWND